MNLVPVKEFDTIQRDELHAQGIELLTRDRPQSIALATGLYGGGGFGKTVSAEDLCRDPLVREYYSGGILWVTLSESCHQNGLVGKINDLTRALNGAVGSSTIDIERAGRDLGDLLRERERSTLIVLDDVWRKIQVDAFRSRPDNCALMVTTRNLETIPRGAKALPVEDMTRDEAAQLLCADLDGVPPELVREVLDRTGGWALVISLANRHAVKRVRAGETTENAVAAVLRDLRERGPSAVDLSSPSQRHDTVGATVDASLRLLSDDNAQEVEHYLTLACATADRRHVPLPFIAAVWGLSIGEADRMCRRFADLSLVRRQPDSSVVIHEVLVSHLRGRMSADELRRRHARFARTAESWLNKEVE